MFDDNADAHQISAMSACLPYLVTRRPTTVASNSPPVKKFNYEQHLQFFTRNSRCFLASTIAAMLVVPLLLLGFRPATLPPLATRVASGTPRATRVVASSTAFIRPLADVGAEPLAATEVVEPLSAAKPLLLFLPGIDGTGLAGVSAQWPRLAPLFDIRALKITTSDRSTFDDLLSVVVEFVREEATSRKYAALGAASLILRTMHGR